MKDFFKKLINVFLVLITIFNTVVSPLTVFASNETKGDLKLEVEGETLQYVKNNNGSVSATSGSFTNPGDVEVRKSVRKLDDNGNYEVKFEARGKRTSDETSETGDIYAVIVFDRSNSMKDDTKWSNAKTAAKNFAKGLHEKYASAKIAMVTFGSEAKITRNFATSDFSKISDGDLFGYQPYSDRDETGGTNLQSGLKKAYDLFNGLDEKIKNDSKKYVLVISDGKPTYYYDDNNELHADGITTTKTNLDQTFKAATSLKSLAEIFTIGYDLSTGKVCNNCYPYNDYTAETVLKKVATKESNYYGSNVNSIVSVINDVLKQTTVYSPAATNLVITDNIGSNFTSTSDTDNDGKIVLRLSETTRLDSDAWQEVGKFTITIDKDSETGWHQTNNNFTYTYDGLNDPVICTKNPEVYWVQTEYNYSIEYYYDGLIDTSKTESGVAYKDSKVSVSNTKINNNLKEGYKFVSVNPSSKEITIKNSGDNVIKVYYEKDTFNYTIEYYYDGKIDNSKTENNKALFASEIATYPDKVKTGYKLEKVETTETDKTLPLVISSNSAKNIIKVYYVKNSFGYKVEYYYDNLLDDSQTYTSKAEYLSTVSTYPERDKKGYSFEKTENLPLTIDADTLKNIIKVYYVSNEYNYTIYHVEKNNENNILGTDNGVAKYQENIIVNAKEFTGFTYDSKDKEKIVIDLEKNIAYVYYTRNAYKYTIEYYKENLNGKYDLVSEDTVTKENVLFGSKTTFEIKKYIGYTYDESKTENADSVVPTNNDLVIRLYYNLNESEVIVHYVVKVEDNYIPFEVYGRDELDNNLPDFVDIDLENDIFKGKIGTEFTTVYRKVKDYNFIGIYDGNILEDSNIEKISGTKITSTIPASKKEYTYVYEPPMGDGEELPPQTGVEQSFNYVNYILLLALIYIIKKYFELITK